MILFKQFHVPLILNGTKTVTRRAGLKRWNKDAVHEAKTSYTSEPFARLRIMDEPYKEKLSSLTPQEAKAEGGYTVHERCLNKTMDKLFLRTFCNNCHNSDDCFQKVWININGNWNPNDTPWVVRFKVLTNQNTMIVANLYEL